MNEYSSVITPGYKDICGVALATNGVTVNNDTADRHGEYFHRQISVANSGGPAWQDVTVISGGVTDRPSRIGVSGSRSDTYV